MRQECIDTGVVERINNPVIALRDVMAAERTLFESRYFGKKFWNELYTENNLNVMYNAMRDILTPSEGSLVTVHGKGIVFVRECVHPWDILDGIQHLYTQTYQPPDEQFWTGLMRKMTAIEVKQDGLVSYPVLNEREFGTLEKLMQAFDTTAGQTVHIKKLPAGFKSFDRFMKDLNPRIEPAGWRVQFQDHSFSLARA